MTLTSANWSAQSPKLTGNSNSALNYSTQQRNQIKENYIDKGYTVKIPRSLIDYDNWKGAVFVAECNKCDITKPINQRTLGATYAISGGYAGGYTVRPSQPTVHYNANLNSGYLSSAITPSLVNTQIADQGIPQNSTTAAAGFNWNQVYAGDPVNLVTGNFYHNERDIHIPGRGGLDLVFERSYNSHNPKDGPLGFG